MKAIRRSHLVTEILANLGGGGREGSDPAGGPTITLRLDVTVTHAVPINDFPQHRCASSVPVSDGVYQGFRGDVTQF